LLGVEVSEWRSDTVGSSDLNTHFFARNFWENLLNW
jgi:hypothetical protein